MKIMKLTTLLLAFLVFNTTLKAQVNDIWIKTPPLGMIPYPAPYFKASIELDITEGQFVDNRPLIRVSGLENVGGTVNRNVMLFMKPSGILGIGTSNPTSLLHLNKSTVKQGVLSFSYENATGVQINSSELGINTSNNSYWMGGAYAIGGTNSFFNAGYNTASKIEFDDDGISFYSTARQGSSVINTTHWKKGMVIDKQGKVRLGDETVYGTHSDFKLSVDGKIVAKKIIVTNGSEWADYVFSPDYNLMPLSELKLYIEKNQHLPNIPTTAEVAEDGVDVYEMNKKLLEKVEELTLYMLKLEKRLNELEK